MALGEWILISRSQDKERVTESYSCSVSTGTVLKNVTSYIDQASGLIKALSESMIYISSSGGGGGGDAVPPLLGDVKTVYFEALGVPPNDETVIGTFTAQAPTNSFVYKVTAAGTNAASFKLYIKGELVDQLYTPIAGPFNVSFDLKVGDYAGVALEPGDEVEVRVTHERIDAGAFNFSVLYMQQALA